jgi:hypothetical protein
MFPVNDWFDAFLVGGFLFGILFTLGTIMLGFADLGGDPDTGHDFHHGVDANGHMFHLFNVSSILAFITWFSGVTYLLRNGLGLIVGLAVLVGLVFGIAGAWAISWFLYSFLRKNSPELDPRDWDEVGQIGRVTGTIFPNGYGEVVYERHGSRHAIPARTKDGVGIERQTEVVILDIQKGVAIVQPWAELMDEITLER